MKTGNIRATKSLRVDADPIDNVGVGNIEYNDARYYTVDKINTISGSLQINIDGKSNTNHLHDDRYYTETELNNGQLDNQYYTESEINTISGSLNTKINDKADVIHIHDDRYYTETEIDTISGSLQTNINGKSDLTHLHDDRYYTETELNNGQLDTRYYTELEVDDLITTVSGKLDDHNELNNLDYASSGHTGFQPAGDYLTDSEFSTYSGTLQSQIDGKSNTSHLHDDRYYTESEIDTISGSLNTSKSDVGHSHTESDISDLDKYTQAEVDGLITTISGKLDDHNELNNLDYASAGHTGFQPAGDYTTDSELTTLSGNLQTNIDGKSDTAHLHDDRYYTETELNNGQLDNRYYIETEIDTISGSLNTKIESKDNYQNWKFAVDGVTKDDITSEDTLNFVGGDNITITRSADDEITISGSAGEYGVKLDSLLSADGKYSGITCDGVLGATLAFGDLVYLNTADQRWELTDADAEATAGDVMLAIVLAAGNDGDTRLLLLRGFVREDDWNFTSYGQALFVSCIAGDMIQTVVSGTGDIVRVVGYASTFADQIYFNPSKTWLEIT